VAATLTREVEIMSTDGPTAIGGSTLARFYLDRMPADVLARAGLEMWS
jgi:hypothetical protein